MSDVTRCHNSRTTLFSVALAALSASSWLWAYNFIVRLASLWPIQAATPAARYIVGRAM
jgi:hypothetical protein